jgi:hypothetical protein
MFSRDDEKYLVTKMISFETLVSAIEELEEKGVISLEEFKNLPYPEIKRRFFRMPASTTIQKAIIKITDKRNGHKEFSTQDTVTEYWENGELKKIVVRTSIF